MDLVDRMDFVDNELWIREYGRRISLFTFFLPGPLFPISCMVPCISMIEYVMPKRIYLIILMICMLLLPARTHPEKAKTLCPPFSTKQKQLLLEKVNMDYPGLEKCKKRYNKKEYKRSYDELMNYYQTIGNHRYFQEQWEENQPKISKKLLLIPPDLVYKKAFYFSGHLDDPGDPIDWNYLLEEHSEWNAALNRLIFLETFLHYYKYTHRKKYFEMSIQSILGWILNGPAKKDNTLGYSYRMMMMIRSYQTFMIEENFSNDMKGWILQSLEKQAHYMKDHRPDGGWRSAWCYSSILFSRMYPEFKISAALLPAAHEGLQDFIENDYYEDGLAKSSSLMYHTFVETPFFFKTSELYYQNGWKFPFKNMMEKIYLTYGKLQRPDKLIPLLGDGEYRPISLLKEYQTKAAKYTKNNELLWIATDGEQGDKPGFTSVELPQSGLAIFRDNWSKDSGYVCMNTGYGNGWHGHYDHLNFLYYANETEILRDSAIPSYEKKDRKHFRKSCMHNLPTFGDQGQEAQGKYPSIHRGKIIYSHFDNTADITASTYDYNFIRKGLSLQRTLYYCKENFLICIDDISGNKDKVKFYFQIGKDYKKITDKDNIIRLRKTGKDAAIIAAVPYQGFTSYYGSENPYLGWTSEQFNHPEKAWTIELEYPASDGVYPFIIVPDIGQTPQYSYTVKDEEHQLILKTKHSIYTIIYCPKRIENNPERAFKVKREKR